MDYNLFRINNETLKINFAIAEKEVQELLEYLRTNPEITSLSLINTEITSDLIKIIANSPHLENLTSLDLSDNKIGTAGAKKLTNLTSLALSSNKIGDEGAKNIANSDKLTNLTFLDLSSNKIGTEGAKDIANSDKLTNLTSLALSYNEIGTEGAKDIANSDKLTNLTSLALSYNKIGTEGAKDIANSDKLTNLTFLDLSFNKIGDEGVKDIANSDKLTNLTFLDLSSNKIGTEGAKDIANSDKFTNLTSLTLSYNHIEDAGAKNIANSDKLTNLTSLDLSSNEVGDEGVKDIANSDKLTNLTSLTLSYNHIEDAGAKNIANSDKLTNLTSLDLSYNHIGAAGAKNIANSDKLTNLTSLALSSNEVGDEGAKDIANSDKLTNLTSLDLSNNKIGTKGAKDIANSDKLTNLTSLALSSNEVGDEGAKDIANSDKLTNLTSLDLSNNKIGTKGAKDIANSDKLTNLTSLDLSYNEIGDEGAKDIANSDKLTNLTSLALSSNEIGAAGVELLAESLMKVSIRFEHKIGQFYSYLVKIKNAQASDKGNNIAALVKDMIFDIAQGDENDAVTQHIIKNPDKYPFLINSIDSSGNRLDHFYNHAPEMQKFLFEHGLVPKQEEHQDRVIQNIVMNNQSVHDKEVVKKTNFMTHQLVTKLVPDMHSSAQNKLPQKAEEYQNSILPNLFNNGKGELNPLAIKLLDLTEDDKKSVLAQVLENNAPPQDAAFVKLVKDHTRKVLQDRYLRKNASDQYDVGYSTHPMQYDWTEGAEKKITIPESIGLIEAFIERASIPRKDKQELCATLLSTNSELVEKNLGVIKAVLQKDDISLQELQKPSILHTLLDNLSEEQIGKLFQDVSSLDIEDSWRDQQQFKLAKQLYVAATTYGNNSTACTQGTWSQIIATAEEIDTELLTQYAEHKEILKREEALKRDVTAENIVPLIDQIFTEFAKDPAIVNGNPEIKDAVLEFATSSIDISKPAELALGEQQVLARANQGFTKYIKEHLPNYNRDIPTFQEYKTFIDEMANSSQAEKLVRLVSTPAPQEVVQDIGPVMLSDKIDPGLNHHNLDTLDEHIVTIDIIGDVQ